MKCDHEAVKLMHHYLDGDLSQKDEQLLRSHLESCEACQKHFRELKKTVAFVTATSDIKTSSNFTSKVMAQLPKEKKGMTVKRWFKAHPIFTAAAIFFIFMVGGIFSSWNQDQQLTYPKGKELIVESDTVIVPEGVTIEEDLEIKNGNLRVEGEVLGDITMINGEHLSASAGKVVGDIKEVDQVFSWLWYKLKGFMQNVFSLQ